MAEKWKLVNRKVYRLSEVFNESEDAVAHGKELKKDHWVFLTKTTDGKWAVYYRPKELTSEFEEGMD